MDVQKSGIWITVNRDEAVIPPHHSAALSVEQVCIYLGGMSERKIWAMVSTGEFPQPVKLGRCSRWRRVDVDKWLASLN